MPRKRIELEHAVEYLSVLGADGRLDEELEPDLDDELLLRMHRTMLLSRRFDERLLTLQRQGRIGTFAPTKGQEAAQIGAMAAVREQDWFVPSFREFGAMIWRGTPLAGLIVFTAGYNEGGAIPEERHDLPVSVPVATQIPHAVGLAYAARYRELDEIAIAFFGDGATSEGDFHEGLNLAGVLNTPVVFLCQNNHWAISMPRERQSKSRTLAQKGLAYGIPALQVDGNDVLAVYAAVREAAGRARSGDGPTLIECVTYRLSVHTTADDPSKYRDEEEVEQWEGRDPLPRFQDYLIKKDLLSRDDIDTLEDEVKQQVGKAWKEAEAQIKELTDPLVMFDYIHTDPPAYLQAQRQALAARLEHGD